MRGRGIAEITIAVVAAVVLLAACDASGGGRPGAPPDRTPDITGEVVAAALPNGRSGQGLGSIEVSGTGRAYDRAVVTITESTAVFRVRATSSGPPEPAGIEDVRIGDVVDTWFIGPAAESYPVQATAEAVAILTPD